MVKGRVKLGPLFLLACGVLGGAAIHRLTHGVWFARSPSTWPRAPEARRGAWTRWEAVPLTAPIQGVWGARPDSVWAWGRSALIHWDGRAWSRGPLPPAFAEIQSMGGTADAVWIRFGPAWNRNGAQCWWDSGGGWRPEACPASSDPPAGSWSGTGGNWPPDEPGPLSAINLFEGHRLASNDVWAVDGSRRYLGHFDGKDWAVGAARSELLTGVRDIWLASENDGWAIARTMIFRWNGREWKPAAQAPGDLRALWGSAADDVWAVGSDGLTVHWDGARWSESRRDGGPTLTALSGRGRNDVWAGGCIENAVVLLHWNGWSWQRRDTASDQHWDYTDRTCPALVATGGGQALAVVDNRGLAFVAGGPSDPAIRVPEVRFDLPRGGGKITALMTIDSGETWALGSQRVDTSPQSPVPFAVRFAPGAPPEFRRLPGNGEIRAVTARAREMWAVGTGGLLLHFDGAFWTRQPIETDEAFVGVHGAGQVVWIAGSSGTLLRQRL